MSPKRFTVFYGFWLIYQNESICTVAWQDLEVAHYTLNLANRRQSLCSGPSLSHSFATDFLRLFSNKIDNNRRLCAPGSTPAHGHLVPLAKHRTLLFSVSQSGLLPAWSTKYSSWSVFILPVPQLGQKKRVVQWCIGRKQESIFESEVWTYTTQILCFSRFYLGKSHGPPRDQVRASIFILFLVLQSRKQVAEPHPCFQCILQIESLWMTIVAVLCSKGQLNVSGCGCWNIVVNQQDTNTSME